MAAEFDAGDIEARLTVDKDPFDTGLDEAQRKGDAFDGQKFEVTLDADDDPLVSKINTRRQALKAFGDQTYSPTFDADDEQLVEKLDANIARANELSDQVYSIKVKANDDQAKAALDNLKAEADRLVAESYAPHVSLDGVTEVNAQLDDLEAKLTTFNERRVAATVSVSGAGGAGKDLDTAAKSADNADHSLSLLVTAALLATPPLLAIGTVGAGALIGLAGAAANAAPGLAGVALAAKETLTGVVAAGGAQTAYATAVAESGVNSAAATTALGALTKSMAALSPLEQEAATQFSAFTGEYKTWARSFDPQILGDFESGLTLAGQGLSFLTPAVKSSATALGGLETAARTALGGIFWQQFSTFLGTQATPAITSFGRVIGGLGTTFAGLDEAFAPLISNVEADLDNLATHLEAFGTSAAGNQGIGGFVSYVQTNGPLVLATLENLGKTVLTLGEDFGRTGPSFLELLNPLATLITDLGQIDPILPTIVAAFIGWQKVVGPLTSGLNGLQGVVGKVASGFGTVKSAEQDAATVAKTAGAESTLAWGSILGPIGLVAFGITAVIGLFQSSDGAARAAAASAETWSNAFVQGLQQQGLSATTQQGRILQQIGALQAQSTALAKSNQGLAQQQTALVQAATPAERLEGANFGLAGATAASATQFDAHAKAIAKNNDVLQTNADKVRVLQEALANSVTQQNAQAQAMSAALAPTNNLTEDQNLLQVALSNVDTAAKNVGTALNTMIGINVNADTQAITFQQDLVTLAAGLHTTKNGVDIVTNSLNINTDAGRTNKTALDNLIQTTLTQISTAATQHKSIADVNSILGDNITQIEGVGKQYGWSKTQVDQYLTSMGLTPGTVNTILKQQGYDTGIDKAQTLSDTIAGMKDKTISVTIQTAEHDLGSYAGVILGATPGHASGGLIGGGTGRGFKTHGTALVGEDGSGYPEYVVPTNPVHRANALALTGSLMGDLGMMAAGGVINRPDYTGPAYTGRSYQSPGSKSQTTTINVNGSALGTLAASLPGVIAGIEQQIGSSALSALTQALATSSSGVAGAGSAAPSSTAAALGQSMAAARGWTGGLWVDLNNVAERESGWSMTAQNPSSGAYGIAQFINGPGEYADYGGNANTLGGQITAFLNYIEGRYGTPAGAWAHEINYGWYDQGGTVSPGLTVVNNQTGHDEFIVNPSTLAAGSSTSPSSAVAALLQVITDFPTSVLGLTTALDTLDQQLTQTSTGSLGVTTSVGTLTDALTTAASTVAATSVTVADPVRFSGDTGTVNTVGGTPTPVTDPTATVTAPTTLSTLTGVATAIQDLLGHDTGNGLSQTGLPAAFYQALQPALTLGGVGSLPSTLFQTGSAALSLNGADPGGQQQLARAMEAALAEIEAEIAQLPPTPTTPNISNPAAAAAVAAPQAVTISPVYNVNVVGGSTAAETAAAIQQALDAHTADLIASLP